VRLPTLSKKILVACRVAGLTLAVTIFFLSESFRGAFDDSPVGVLAETLLPFILVLPSETRVADRENVALQRDDVQVAALEEAHHEVAEGDPEERKISNIFSLTQTRLRKEVEALGKRSSLNLVVGVLITASGTLLLAYLVTRDHAQFQFRDLKDVLAYYIPRITTVALIETFAYFFLGLYKANLQEIKFYQGERTTITALEIAWLASLRFEIGTSTADVIQQIVRTDRNRSLTVAGGNDAGPNQSDILEVIKGLTKLAGDAAKSKG
jgi:hypothetical protein